MKSKRPLLFCLVLLFLAAGGCGPEKRTGAAPFLSQDIAGPETTSRAIGWRENLADSCLAPRPGVVPADLSVPEDRRKPVIYPQLGHYARALRVGPDGKYVASGSMGGEIKLWDVASERELWTVRAYSNGVADLAFDPGGSRIYSIGHSQEILIWNTANGDKVGRVPVKTQDMGQWRGRFTAQGTHTFLSYWDKTRKKWFTGIFALPSGRLVHEMEGGGLDAVSPNGRFAGMENYPVFNVWDVCSRRIIFTHEPEEKERVSSAAISPDGSRLAIWVYVERKEDVGSLMNYLAMLELPSGRELWRGARQQGGYCLRMDFNGNGRLFFQGGYPSEMTEDRQRSAVLVFDAESGKIARKFEQAGSGAFAQTPDGLSTVVGMDHRIAFIDNRTLETGRTLSGYGRHFPAVVGPEGRLFTPHRVWDPKTGVPVRSLIPAPEAMYGYMALGPEGKEMLTASQDGSDRSLLVTRWDLPTGRKLGETRLTPSAPVKFLFSPTLSPDGRCLILNEDLKIARAVDAATGKVLQTFAAGKDGQLTHFSFSNDGRLLVQTRYHYEDGSAGARNQVHPIEVWETATWRKKAGVRLKSVSSVHGAAVGADGKVLISTWSPPVKDGELWRQTLLLLDAAARTVLWKKEKPLAPSQYSDIIRHMVISPDGKHALASGFSGRVALLEMAKGEVLREMEGGPSWMPHYMAFSLDKTRVYAASADGVLWIWDCDTGKELARIMEFKGGEWLSITPEGYYASSEKGDRYLNVRVGLQVQGIGQYYNTFYRPDLVLAKLQEDRGGDLPPAAVKTIAEVAARGGPPGMTVVSPRDGVTLAKRDTDVVVEVTDRGGGVGRIEWKINGVTVGITDEKARGVALVGKDAGGLSLRFRQLLTLSPGENLIQVTAYSRTNEVSSLPAEIRLRCRDEISERPSLYLLTVGIDRYRDGALRLKYSVPDAKSVAEAFRTSSASVFERIVIEQIFDEEVTLTGIDAAFARLQTRVQTHDVFVLYIAGHGVARDGRYHLLPYDFRYRSDESITRDGITQEHLQKWLAGVQARKSLVLLDTCNSGAFTNVQAQQRGIGEKTAVDRLTRATGRAVIVAAKDNQPAMEGYEGHGIFTHVFLKAFKEADRLFGNGDGQVSVFEMAAYIGEHVPRITYQKFGYEQVPQMNLQGQDFPIAAREK